MIFMTLLVILVGDIDSLCCSYGQKIAFISIFELSDCKKVVKKAYFLYKIGGMLQRYGIKFSRPCVNKCFCLFH